MRVIKPGNPPSKRTLKFRCTSCGCEFEVSASECHYENDQRDGDYYAYKCPESGCNSNCTHYAAERYGSNDRDRY